MLARRTSPAADPVLVVPGDPKGDRGELAVELMTEVGIDVIVPWAARALRGPVAGDRADKALDRWRAAAPRGGQAVAPEPGSRR